MSSRRDVKPLVTYSRKRARPSTPVTPREDAVDLTGDTSASDASKDMMENPDDVMHTNVIAHDGLERVGNHWRNVLEQMLQFPDISEGTGVHSCIHNALILGPSCFSRKANTIDTPEDVTEPNDRYENHPDMQGHNQRAVSSLGATSDMSKTRTRGKVIMNDNTTKCQNVFFKMLCSDKFALLCDLICGSLLENKALGMVDFGLINSKMTNGDYEVSPELFDQDIQQVWEKVKKIGKEIFHLGSSLSNLSLASFQKQVGEDLVYEAGEQKLEDACEVGVEQRNSTGSNMTTQFPGNESDRSTKLQQTEASCLYEVFTCKKCGTEADGQHRLICDECEAIYHFSCVEPAVQEVPTHSWYCSACMPNWKGSSQPATNCMETPEPLFVDDDIQQDRLHENCVVCDRLDFSNIQERPNETRSASIAKDSRESSVSSIESDEPPEPSRTAMLHLCKLCGTCEDDDKRFLICGHTQCPYKYYHVRCLKNGQIASLQQKTRPCWYCPSCLCRGCFSDTDDDKIVLCDACDEGYHIYCMKPPRTSIPKGQWYCISCNIARARQGMRSYEQLILQQHGKDVAQATQVNRSVDVLLSAAEKLNSEERLTTRKKYK